MPGREVLSGEFVLSWQMWLFRQERCHRPRTRVSTALQEAHGPGTVGGYRAYWVTAAKSPLGTPTTDPAAAFRGAFCNAASVNSELACLPGEYASIYCHLLLMT